MLRPALRNDMLLDRAIQAVDNAVTLDKALAHLAGLLYPSFFPRRVDVGMRVSHDRLVICGVWSAQATRLKKGAVLRAGASGFPDLVEHRGVVFSSDLPKNPAAEALEVEEVQAWVAVPLPSASVVEGGLGICARTDVFNGRREFFASLGLEIGERLAALARASEPYRYEREQVLVLDRPLPGEKLTLF